MKDCKEYMIEMGDTAGRSYITYHRKINSGNPKWERGRTRSARGALDFFCNSLPGSVELGDGVIEALLEVDAARTERKAHCGKYKHKNREPSA